MSIEIIKFVRTPHLEGSRLQSGDEDLSQVRVSELFGKRVIIEEKVDGANAGISFSHDGSLLLQSRGHYLTGGPREKHWDLFKQWAAVHEATLLNIIGDRYIIYGEWLFAKHTVFYDLLPHYFLAFDVFDKETNTFISTQRRLELLHGSPIVSVNIIQDSIITCLDDITQLITMSYYKTGRWKDNLNTQAQNAGVAYDVALRQTDKNDTMEGLYIKVENDDSVLERYKWVRSSFLNSIADADGHWLERPIIQNMLAPYVDIFR